MDRVATSIQHELAEAISRRLKDPRVGFVTISAVEVSSDLSHAKVLVSVLGDEETKSSALAGLESAAGFLRSHLARSLEMRTVPALHFILDRGVEHRARVDALLARDGGETTES